jgi:hypothetical protein
MQHSDGQASFASTWDEAPPGSTRENLHSPDLSGIYEAQIPQTEAIIQPCFDAVGILETDS